MRAVGSSEVQRNQVRSKVQQELGSGKGGLLLDIYQENLSEPYMRQEWESFVLFSCPSLGLFPGPGPQRQRSYNLGCLP